MSPVWPFVVTRNRLLDWRPVAAPAFLVDAHRDFLLLGGTAGPDHPQPPTTTRVDDDELGPLTLLYRSRPVAACLADVDGATTDRFGRPIHAVEGVVARGTTGPEPDVLDRIGPLTDDVVRAFWSCEDEGTPPVATEPVTQPLSR